MAGCEECKKKLAIIKQGKFVNKKQSDTLKLYKEYFAKVGLEIKHERKKVKNKCIQSEYSGEETDRLYSFQIDQNKKFTEEIANLRKSLKEIQTKLPQTELTLKHVNFVNKQLVSYYDQNEKSLVAFKKDLKALLKHLPNNSKAKACLDFINDFGRRPIGKQLKEIIAKSDEPVVKKICEDLLNNSLSPTLSLASSGIEFDISDSRSVCSETSTLSLREYKNINKTAVVPRPPSSIISPAYSFELPQVDSLLNSEEEIYQGPVPAIFNKSNDNNASSCDIEKEFSTEVNDFNKTILETFAAQQSCLNTEHQSDSANLKDFDLGNFSLLTNFSNFDCNINLFDNELPEFENDLAGHPSLFTSSPSVNFERLGQDSLPEQNLLSCNTEIKNLNGNCDSRFIPPRNEISEILPADSQDSILHPSSAITDYVKVNKRCDASVKSSLNSKETISCIKPNSGEKIELEMTVGNNSTANNIVNKTKELNNQLPSSGDQLLIPTQFNETSQLGPNTLHTQMDTTEEAQDITTLHTETDSNILHAHSSSTSAETQVPINSHVVNNILEETQDLNTLHTKSNTYEETQVPCISHALSKTSEETQDHKSSYVYSNTSAETQVPLTSHVVSNNLEETQVHKSSYAHTNTSAETQVPSTFHAVCNTLEESQDSNSLHAQSNTSEETKVPSNFHALSKTSEETQDNKSSHAHSNTSKETHNDNSRHSLRGTPEENNLLQPPSLEASKHNSTPDEFVCSNSNTENQKSSLTCKKNLCSVNSFNPLLDEMNEYRSSQSQSQETKESDLNNTDYSFSTKPEDLEFNYSKDNKNSGTTLKINYVQKENEDKKSVSPNKSSKVTEEYLVSKDYHASEENNKINELPGTLSNTTHVKNSSPRKYEISKSICTDSSGSNNHKSNNKITPFVELESIQNIPQILSPINSVRSMDDSSDTEFFEANEDDANHVDRTKDSVGGKYEVPGKEMVFGEIYLKPVNKKPILKKSILQTLPERNFQNNGSQALKCDKDASNYCKLGVKKTSDLIAAGSTKHEIPLIVNCPVNKNKQTNNIFETPNYMRSNVFVGDNCCGQSVKSEINSPNENMSSEKHKRSNPNLFLRNRVEEYPYLHHNYYENYEMPFTKKPFNCDCLTHVCSTKSNIFTRNRGETKSLEETSCKTYRWRDESSFFCHNSEMEKQLPGEPVFPRFPKTFVDVGLVVKKFQSLDIQEQKHDSSFLFTNAIKSLNCYRSEESVFPSLGMTLSSKGKSFSKNIVNGVPFSTSHNKFVASDTKPIMRVDSDVVSSGKKSILTCKKKSEFAKPSTSNSERSVTRMAAKPKSSLDNDVFPSLLTQRVKSKSCERATISTGERSVNFKEPEDGNSTLNLNAASQNSGRIPSGIHQSKLIEATNNGGSNNEGHGISVRCHPSNAPPTVSSDNWSNVFLKAPNQEIAHPNVCLNKFNSSEKLNTTLNIKAPTSSKTSCDSTTSNPIDNIKLVSTVDGEFTTLPLQSNTISPSRNNILNKVVPENKRKFENSESHQESIRNTFSGSHYSKKPKTSNFYNSFNTIEKSKNNESLLKIPGKNENGTDKESVINQPQLAQKKKLSFKLPNCTKRKLKNLTINKYFTNENEDSFNEEKVILNKSTSSEFLKANKVLSPEKSPRSINDDKINLDKTIVLESTNPVQPPEMLSSSSGMKMTAFPSKCIPKIPDLLSGAALQKSQIDNASALKKSVTFNVNGDEPKPCNIKKNEFDSLSLQNHDHNIVQSSFEKIDPPKVFVSQNQVKTNINKASAEMIINSPKNILSICSDSALQKDRNYSSEEINRENDSTPLSVLKEENKIETENLALPNKMQPPEEQESSSKEMKFMLSKSLSNESAELKSEERLNNLQDKHRILVSNESHANNNILENKSSQESTYSGNDFSIFQSSKNNYIVSRTEKTDEEDNKTIKIDKDVLLSDVDTPTVTPSRKRISHFNNSNKTSIINQPSATNHSEANNITNNKNINIKTIKKNEKITPTKRKKDKEESCDNNVIEESTFKKPKLQASKRENKGTAGKTLLDNEEKILEEIFKEMQLEKMLSPLPLSPARHRPKKQKINTLKKSKINDKDSINDKDKLKLSNDLVTSEISQTEKINDNIKAESYHHKLDFKENSDTRAGTQSVLSSAVDTCGSVNVELNNSRVHEDLELSSDSESDSSEIIDKANAIVKKIDSNPSQLVECKQNPLNDEKHESKITSLLNECSETKPDLQNPTENNLSLSMQANNNATKNEIDLKSSIIHSFYSNVKPKHSLSVEGNNDVTKNETDFNNVKPKPSLSVEGNNDVTKNETDFNNVKPKPSLSVEGNNDVTKNETDFSNVKPKPSLSVEVNNEVTKNETDLKPSNIHSFYNNVKPKPSLSVEGNNDVTKNETDFNNVKPKPSLSVEGNNDITKNETDFNNIKPKPSLSVDGNNDVTKNETDFNNVIPKPSLSVQGNNDITKNETDFSNVKPKPSLSVEDNNEVTKNETDLKPPNIHSFYNNVKPKPSLSVEGNNDITKNETDLKQPNIHSFYSNVKLKPSLSVQGNNDVTKNETDFSNVKPKPSLSVQGNNDVTKNETDFSNVKPKPSLSVEDNNDVTKNETDLKTSIIHSFYSNLKSKSSLSVEGNNDVTKKETDSQSDETIEKCNDKEPTIWNENNQGVLKAYPGKKRLASVKKPNISRNLTSPPNQETCFGPESINMVEQAIVEEINVSNNDLQDIESIVIPPFWKSFFSVKQEGKDVEVPEKCKSQELHETKVENYKLSEDDILNDNTPKRHKIPQIVPDYRKPLLSKENSTSSSVGIKNENAPMYPKYETDSCGSSNLVDNTNNCFKDGPKDGSSCINKNLQANTIQPHLSVDTQFVKTTTIVEDEDRASDCNKEFHTTIQSFYKELSACEKPVTPKSETTIVKTVDGIILKNEKIRNNQDKNIQPIPQGNPSEIDLKNNSIHVPLRKLRPTLYWKEYQYENIWNLELIDCSKDIFYSTIKFLESKIITGEETFIPTETLKEKEAEQRMKNFIQKEIYRVMNSECKFAGAKKIVKSLKNNKNMVIMPKSFARAVCETIAAEKDNFSNEKPAMGKHTLSCCIFTMLYVGKTHNDFLLEVLRVIEECLGSYHDRTLIITFAVRMVAYYTVICRAYSLDIRVKHLIIDLIYSRYNKACGIVLKILEMWPELLVYRSTAVKEDCLLTQTIVSLLLSNNKDMMATKKKTAPLIQQTYCSKNLRNLLRSYYGYSSNNFTSNYKELIEKCLIDIQYEEARKSLILICHCAPIESVTSVVSNQMVPILEGWMNGNFSHQVAIQVLVTTALIIRGMPLGKTMMFVNQNLLLFEKILHKSPDPIFAERVIEGIFYLRRHNIHLCFDIITHYSPTFKQMTKETMKYVRGIISASKLSHWLHIYKVTYNRFTRV